MALYFFNKRHWMASPLITVIAIKFLFVKPKNKKRVMVYVTISDNASPDVPLDDVLLPVLMGDPIFALLIVSRPFWARTLSNTVKS